MLGRTLRAKDCRICGDEFDPRSTLQRTCGPKCALEDHRQKHERRERAKQRRLEQEERKSIRERKEALRTKPEWISLVQNAFNRFIRLRDEGLPCISCGASEEDVERDQSWKFGGAWDCGHFLSVASHPELRFHEDNAHRQCKSCNGGSGNWGRKNRTVSADYRDNLVEKIGLERVEWLEGPHDPANYTIEELRELLAHYRKKVRDILTERDS